MMKKLKNVKSHRVYPISISRDQWKNERARRASKIKRRTSKRITGDPNDEGIRTKTAKEIREKTEYASKRMEGPVGTR